MPLAPLKVGDLLALEASGESGEEALERLLQASAGIDARSAARHLSGPERDALIEQPLHHGGSHGAESHESDGPIRAHPHISP